MERITYIYLYTNEDVRYIMNRSIPFENVVGKKMLAVLNLIGVNMYSKILIELETELQKFKYATNFESTHIRILETHGEWENIKHSDQKDINVRKNALAEEYGAVVRKDNIEIKDADKEISIFVVATIKKMLRNVSNAIDTFIHSELKDENDVLSAQNKLLKNENDKIQSELPKLTEQYNKYVAEIPLLEKKCNDLEKKYNEYITCIYGIENKKQEYDKLETKVDDLKWEIERLNTSIAILVARENRLKCKTNI